MREVGGVDPLPTRTNMIPLGRSFWSGSYEYDSKILVGIYLGIKFGALFFGLVDRLFRQRSHHRKPRRVRMQPVLG